MVADTHAGGGTYVLPPVSRPHSRFVRELLPFFSMWPRLHYGNGDGLLFAQYVTSTLYYATVYVRAKATVLEFACSSTTSTGNELFRARIKHRIA